MRIKKTILLAKFIVQCGIEYKIHEHWFEVVNVHPFIAEFLQKNLYSPNDTKHDQPIDQEVMARLKSEWEELQSETVEIKKPIMDYNPYEKRLYINRGKQPPKKIKEPKLPKIKKVKPPPRPKKIKKEPKVIIRYSKPKPFERVKGEYSNQAWLKKYDEVL